MPTAAWVGFVHSWHTLAIVLKWMCISVVGIPFAAATCLLIALCAIAFGLLVLFFAFLGCILVYLIFKIIWSLLTRWPYWISQYRIHRAEERLLAGLPLPVTDSRDFPTQQWTKKPGTQRPLQGVPTGYVGTGLFQAPRCSVEAVPPGYIGPDDLPQAPPRLYIAEQFTSKAPAGPATDLPRIIECQVCMEEKLPSMFPSKTPTDNCDHAAIDCCIMCLNQTIVIAFEGNMWDDIRCVNPLFFYTQALETFLRSS
jgi:hypothetical protein